MAREGRREKLGPSGRTEGRERVDGEIVVERVLYRHPKTLRTKAGWPKE